ncbi:hypothetical protein Clacol_005354 [Clathrus columnatus]|uniref:FAD-binding domain-containing protein n=1 Tax=Clathrus columnatus TaxID=1419009 RepID=A0AAV5ADC0_9AGAM|nr:hypothetical protein Clacol_005354 [Clathrus columnatus]
MSQDGPATIARPILAELLQTRLSTNCTIHVSKRLISYEENEEGGVKLNFSDGSISTADVLIAADGIHSASRASMYKILGKREGREGYYEQFIEPKFSGTFAYRCGVPSEKFAALYPNHQVLGDQKFGAARISEGAPYEGPWMVNSVEKKEVTDLYADWEDDLVKLLEHMDTPSRWAVHVVAPLPTFISGPVALIGDAAHAMTPHQGVGGGQAIEDAYILGRLLSHPSANKSNLKDVLNIYEKVRLPKAQNAAALSKSNGLIYDFIDPMCPQNVSSPEELRELGEAVGQSFSWLAKGTLYEDWEDAERQFLNAISQ